MKTKISSLILTQNNERTIRNCVNSLIELSDELVIIDDYSEDKTISIIKKLFPSARFFKRKLNDNFGAQRNFALTKAKHDWVLFIDSDEIITKELSDEIKNTLRNPKFNAYTSRRDDQIINFFFKGTSGRPILLKKNLKFKGKVHEDVYRIPKGYLKHRLLHMKWNNTTQQVNVINRYTRLTAEQWISEGRNYNKFQIFLLSTLFPVFWFFKR